YQGGDLAGVLAKIEGGYFTDLGMNALWLTAPVDNADRAGVGEDGRQYSAYHGYWPTNLNDVEPRFGTFDLFARTVRAAHDRGIKVVLDFVSNHVHEDSPVYRDHPDWFWPLANCICGQTCSWDTLPDRLRCWFRPYLPDFNYQVAAARDFSVSS